MDDSDHASGSSDHEKGLGDVGKYRTNPDLKEQERKESVVSDEQSSSGSSLQDEDEDTPSNHQPHDEANPKMISFEKDDRDNPYNWSQVKKSFVVFVSIATVINSTLGSSIASGATTELASYFHLTDQASLVLPTSIFLVGYTVGPLFCGPISESYGRKFVMLGAFIGYTIFTLACAVAPNWAALIVFRFLVGVFASCPISVVGGICADVYGNPTTRGRAMSVFMAATTWGPVLGPLISGFISVLSWRWAFWFALILAGATLVPLILMPETFGPVILARRARKLRKQRNDPTIKAPIELETHDLRHVVVVLLTRPIRMLVVEPIVLFTCIYLAFGYGVFYMFFQAYPIIYEGVYGFNPGEEGLAFLPIGVGSAIAGCIYLSWDKYLQAARKRDAPWSRSEEFRRLPIACLAGPFLVIALFWAGWSARADVHWIVPILSGIPFGIGYLLLFMALLNYLVDAYEVYSASAMAASGTSRSLIGAVLPFAGRPMFTKLGIAWACSLLGFITLALCLVPFIFIRYGDKIRTRSPFCQQLLREKKEREAKQEKERLDEEAAVEGKGKERPEGLHRVISCH